MKPLTIKNFLTLVFVTFSQVAFAAWPSISDKTDGMEKMSGFFNFYWDEEGGKIFLEIDKMDQEFLYYNSLQAGMGSNDIGLDRGRVGDGHVLHFTRSGPKVLLMENNYGYRANTDNEQEKKAVEQSFAKSVHWGFEVVAAADNIYLIDFTPFLMDDKFDATMWIKRSKQGNFKMDASRSAVYLPATKNFPKNTEFEATITLVTNEVPGDFVESVTPDPQAITVRQHHSLVELPDDGYEPREFDPRSGVGYIKFYDYGTPVSQPLVKRWIRRHRLQKKNPNAKVSEAVEPIIYYLDPGTPEPIRSALMEGASWWNQAFEAAGYKDAFQVRLLPEDADPMDIRYNYIQWVHRSTRGWSYGGGVTDPRTGEIIKGKVTLGSLRIRQDFLIASGLVADYKKGKETDPRMLEMALARIRQLSAHEVGHTLGLPHNYASTYNDRASVMDYPHPYIQIKNGKLDLSEAYDKGIGDWDKISITYAYQDFPEGIDEKEGLEAIIQDYIKDGMKFLTDQDARPSGSAHPYVHLWDNEGNAVDELNRMMEVRKIALEEFSEKRIPFGQPYAMLEEALVPIYLFHRYQVEAASKVVGGLYYNYALRGDGQEITRIVPAEEQYEAIEAILATIDAENLTLPEDVLKMIPPRPYGYDENIRETFQDKTGLTFDPLAAVEAATDISLMFLLQHERASRLIQYKARDSSLPGLDDLIDAVVEKTWKSAPAPGLQGEVERVIANRSLAHLMNLAENTKAADQARAISMQKITELKSWLESQQANDYSLAAHYAYAIDKINDFQDGKNEPALSIPAKIPDGSPIGSDDMHLHNGCSAQWFLE